MGKLSTSDLLRFWELPASYVKAGKHGLRYRNPIEKGIYWYWFSKHIIARDLRDFGRCISCGGEVQGGDCGHFIPAEKGGNDLLFDERNNNLECPQCNAWDELHLLGYARGLDKRYGAGTADSLLERYRAYREGGVQKTWPRQEYVDRLTDIRKNGLFGVYLMGGSLREEV